MEERREANSAAGLAPGLNRKTRRAAKAVRKRETKHLRKLIAGLERKIDRHRATPVNMNLSLTDVIRPHPVLVRVDPETGRLADEGC